MGLFDKKTAFMSSEDLPELSMVAEDPLSAEAVRAKFSIYEGRVNGMLEEAKEFRITDHASLETSLEMLVQATTLGKKLEAKREDTVEKPNTYVKLVNSIVKKFYNKDPKGRQGILNEVGVILKVKINDYNCRAELKRREEEKAAQEKADKLQEDLNKEAEEKGLEPVVIPLVVIEKTNTVVRSEGGAVVYTARPWKAEVVDPDAVDRKLCSPDTKKINEAVKAGVRESPGLRIYQDNEIKLRM